MVQLVLINIGIELRQLIIHVSCIRVILNVEVRVPEKGKSRTVAWLELQLIRQNSNHLGVFLIANQ